MENSILTKEETAWMRKAQKLLDQCPPRLGFYTTGDPDLGVFDRDKEHLFDNERDMVLDINDHDASLGSLRFPSNVHGVCG